jgi:hypothetical protein
VVTDERAVSGEPIPLHRRLVRVGSNPLTQARGKVAIDLAEQRFPVVPCHWPLETEDTPICPARCSCPQRSTRGSTGSRRA